MLHEISSKIEDALQDWQFCALCLLTPLTLCMQIQSLEFIPELTISLGQPYHTIRRLPRIASGQPCLAKTFIIDRKTRGNTTCG